MSGLDLEGRKIIVTGAASGMGRAIAQLFAKNGAHQLLIDVNAEGLDALGLENAETMVVDMTEPAQIDAAVERAVSTMSGLDGVVNAAGILRVIPFEETTPEIYHQVLAVNLHGPYHLCRAALPHLKRERGATIVNISSLAGLIAPEGMTAYAASKAGLLGLTRVMAAELSARVRVNAIAPGVINTAMTQGMVQGSVAAVEEMGLKNSIGRAGTPDEVAELAMFLTSGRSSFITGTTTAIDGGSSWH